RREFRVIFFVSSLLPLSSSLRRRGSRRWKCPASPQSSTQSSLKAMTWQRKPRMTITRNSYSHHKASSMVLGPQILSTDKLPLSCLPKVFSLLVLPRATINVYEAGRIFNQNPFLNNNRRLFSCTG